MKTLFIKKKWIVWFVLATLVMPAFALAGNKALIRDLIIMNSARDLLLYFTVGKAFTPEMEEAIRNGIPVRFSYYVDLIEEKKRWPDKAIVTLSFDRSLLYDSLKEEYRVEFKGENKFFTAGTLEEAKKIMVEVHDLKIASLSDLSLMGKYRLRVKSLLAKKTLPLNFQYILPFSTLWEFETGWYSTEFIYQKGVSGTK